MENYSSISRSSSRKSVNDRLLVPPRPPVKKDNNKTRFVKNNPDDMIISPKIKPMVSCRGDILSSTFNDHQSNPSKDSIENYNQKEEKIKKLVPSSEDGTKPNIVRRSLNFSNGERPLSATESNESLLDKTKSVNDRLCRPVKSPLLPKHTNQHGDVSIMSIATGLSKSSIDSLSSERELNNNITEIKNRVTNSNVCKRKNETNEDMKNDGSSMDSKLRVEFHPDCICFRDLKRVLCKICGKMLVGRIRQLCSVHPRDVYLLDINECPSCELPNYLSEHPFPQGGYPRDTINSKIE